MAVRNILVTGCSSGIGLALAVRLARDELKRFRGERLPGNREGWRKAQPSVHFVTPETVVEFSPQIILFKGQDCNLQSVVQAKSKYITQV